MTDWKIERSNGCCFGQQQLVANSIKKIILHENDPLAGVFAAQKLKIIKTLLTLELSQYGSTFSSSEPVAASRDCSWLRNRVFLYSPFCPAQEICIWFCSQNLLLFSGTAFGDDCHMTGRGLNLDSNLNSATWPTGWKGFISSEVPKLVVWVWILFRTPKIPKLRTAVSLYQPTYASEPQRRARDFCSSLLELSELWRALNFPSRASRL